mmetsp:Transcript_17491/g.27300  ORF Transcript_17491/g.27300 Transcript_17491/m.27300 type:complete len:148 (+) Transcript_17491:371-814(+)
MGQKVFYCFAALVVLLGSIQGLQTETQQQVLSSMEVDRRRKRIVKADCPESDDYCPEFCFRNSRSKRAAKKRAALPAVRNETELACMLRGLFTEGCSCTTPGYIRMYNSNKCILKKKMQGEEIYASRHFTTERICGFASDEYLQIIA